MIAHAVCLGIASPVVADTEPPHPVDPIQAPAPRSSQYTPPPVNPALPVVTVSNMPVPVYARDPDTESRAPAWIATGVTAGFAIVMEAWWLHRDTFEARGQSFVDDPNCHVLTGLYDPNCYIATEQQKAIHNHQTHVWNVTEFTFGVGLGLSGFVAAYLWSRHYHPLHQVGWTPASGGGTVSLSGSF
jgi:hypothetical protein